MVANVLLTLKVKAIESQKIYVDAGDLRRYGNIERICDIQVVKHQILECCVPG